MQSSSIPFSERTATVASEPRRDSIEGIISRCAAELTPTSWRLTEAGLASGPRRLSAVRVPEIRRRAFAAFLIAG